MSSPTKIEIIAFPFGGKKKLAEKLGVSASLVSRWNKRGWIDPNYYSLIRFDLRDIADKSPELSGSISAALDVLDNDQNYCRCCGQRLVGVI